MDKSAIFVDAGYLLARGGLVVCGTKRRAEFDCSYEPLIKALTELSSDHCKLDTLRLYWYDGAPDRIPTPDHLEIGNLPYVKVRLGRIGKDGKHLTIDVDFLQEFFASPEKVGGGAEITRDAVLGIGESLGDQWAAQATRSEMQAVLDQGSIPREIDAQLLRDASRALGTPRLPDEFVRDLRGAFKTRVEAAVAEPSTVETSLA